MLRIFVLALLAFACSAAGAATPDAAAPDGNSPAAKTRKATSPGKAAKGKKAKKGKQPVKAVKKDESLTGSCVTTDIGSKHPCRDIGPTRVVAGSKKLPPKKAEAQQDQAAQVPIGIVVKTTPHSVGR